MRGLLLGVVLAALGALSVAVLWSPSGGEARLNAISPRHLSNATHYPITIYGEGLHDGMELVVGGEDGVRISTAFIDDGHLTARLPPGIEGDAQGGLMEIAARLEGAKGEVRLTVVPDASHPVDYALALSADGERAFVASPLQDRVTVIDRGARAPAASLSTCDGPVDLARWRDRQGTDWLVVACQWAGALWMHAMSDLEAPPLEIASPPHARRLVVVDDEAFVSNTLLDAVVVFDLAERRQTRTLPVGVDPGPLSVGGGKLLVGNEGSTDYSVIDLSSGAQVRFAASRQTEILGGHTARFRPYVMGSQAPRDVLVDTSRGVGFAASLGPNIGPNPERMEVSMNGGISVIDLERGAVLRHVSLIRGVPQRLALDVERGLLYVADVATGRVFVLDAARLAGSKEDAVLGSVELPLSRDTRLIRPEEDFGVNGRNGVAVHVGPRAMALFDDGRRAVVAGRLSHVLYEVDLSQAREGAPTASFYHDEAARRVARGLRWFGEAAFYSDVSNSRMSCDACHYEGHSSGVLFTKGQPMHIYRTPTLRSVRETPPYFTPALIPSLEATAAVVLGRNRFHNPDASRREVLTVGRVQETLTAAPNPHRGPRGELPDALDLPDGAVGSPRAGLALFEGKGGCISCHPPPQFSTDQDASTRQRLHDVGTPIALPLRSDMQDDARYPLPPPSLVGVWSNFPLLHSGAAGFGVTDEGRVLATEPFALRAVVDMGVASKRHGAMHTLNRAEQDDLLAYLLTL